MRILLISDIHSNLTALNAVLQAAGNFDAVWCLGDTVGYGPDPNECIDVLRGLPNLACVVGNHDVAALNLFDINAFNYEARQATRWTQTILKSEQREFLQGLPDRLVCQDVTLVHGSPRQPRWEYLLDLPSAAANFELFDTAYCFVGHTHVPLCFSQDSKNKETIGHILQHQETPVMEGRRLILNPGSVGQPRDHDPRASFAIFSPETRHWELRRVEYDIEIVQTRMRQQNLPLRLIHRLSEGW